MSQNPWKTISKQLMYENPWIRVEEHNVINPSGKKGIYGTVHFKNIAIGIIPVDNEDNTWIVGQYRYPLEQYSWEIIEGGGKIGIDPLDSAKRELLEEAGIVANQWELLTTLHTSNSVTDELGIIYVARDLHFTQSQPDETEQLVVKKIPIKDAVNMVLNNEITDSISMIGLMRYWLKYGITK
ncbi:MAG: NUDIX hydrolase [Flavobacteriales bacterium]|nr:NUDIX hydrolase [Flavobacteriales bacterium]